MSLSRFSPWQQRVYAQATADLQEGGGDLRVEMLPASHAAGVSSDAHQDTKA